jgi:hypothetical protein
MLQTPTLKEKAKWDKWAVVEADLDSSTDTRDNVTVHDDFPAGRIRTIDGYGITSQQKKVNQRNIYSAFPIKEVQSDIMNSAFRTDLKIWLRKYPTPKEQQKHPFEDFEGDVSAFEIIKIVMKNILNTYGLVMNTQSNPGNLTVSHYMTILQKLTSFINKDLMLEYFSLDANYDFRLDLKSTRTANNKKQFKVFISKTNKNQTYAQTFVNNNIEQIVRVNISSVFNYINKISSYITITYDKNNYFVKNTTTHLLNFHIQDNDLQKQQQIKELRNAAKTGRTTMTKEGVASKVWKYKYIPPDPKSTFFERNTKEGTKFREFEPVPRFEKKGVIHNLTSHQKNN